MDLSELEIEIHSIFSAPRLVGGFMAVFKAKLRMAVFKAKLRISRGHSWKKWIPVITAKVAWSDPQPPGG